MDTDIVIDAPPAAVYDTLMDAWTYALWVGGAKNIREVSPEVFTSPASFADDERQHRWLAGAGFEKVRTWWQMSRSVEAEEAELRRLGAGPGTLVRIDAEPRRIVVSHPADESGIPHEEIH